MGKDSAISWCHHTFNLWWGCWKISAGCQRCYAATMDKRTGGDHWQRTGERRFMAEKYWRGPIAWNEAAKKAGERHRVFCGSMMDVGETHPNPVIAAQQRWSERAAIVEYLACEPRAAAEQIAYEMLVAELRPQDRSAA